ncbi:hypothetical protein BST61_g10346 [Cercospora zeina]
MKKNAESGDELRLIQVVTYVKAIPWRWRRNANTGPPSSRLSLRPHSGTRTHLHSSTLRRKALRRVRLPA